MKGFFKREGEGEETFRASGRWPVFVCLLYFHVLESQVGGGGSGKCSPALANMCVYKEEMCFCVSLSLSLYIYTNKRARAFLSVEGIDTAHF